MSRKPGLGEFVKSNMKQGRQQRLSGGGGRQQQQDDKTLRDLQAADALGKISHSIAKTMKAADKAFDEYWDVIFNILETFDRFVVIDCKTETIVKSLIQYGSDIDWAKTYMEKQVKIDVVKVCKWIDRIWNYWTYFEDSQLITLEPFIVRGYMLALYMIKQVYGTIDFNKFSKSLITVKFCLAERIKRYGKENEMGINTWVDKYEDFFGQFGIKVPENYHEEKARMDKEKKEQEKKRRQVAYERMMEKQHHKKRMDERQKLRDQRQKISQRDDRMKKKKVKSKKKQKKWKSPNKQPPQKVKVKKEEEEKEKEDIPPMREVITKVIAEKKEEKKSDEPNNGGVVIMNDPTPILVEKEEKK